MLTAREIYVLGKAAVDANREDYYRGIGTDIISKHPESLILNLDAMIAKLERVKSFAIEYQNGLKEAAEDEPEW